MSLTLLEARARAATLQVSSYEVTVRDRLAERLRDDLPTVLRRAWNDRLDDLDVALAVRAMPR
jgi:hypothetical protein